MSLGLVVLEKKLFTRTWMWMPMPQSDDIMSADIKGEEKPRQLSDICISRQNKERLICAS